MDVVSDILNTLSVRNRVTGLLRLSGDWSFESPEADEAVFHLIFKGSVSIVFQGNAIDLHEGDMVMFTRGHAHVVASEPHAPRVTFAEEDTRVRMHDVNGENIVSVDKQAQGGETSIICARFNFASASAQAMIDSFPDQAIVRRSKADSFTAFEPVLASAAAQAETEEIGALAELDSLVNLLYLSFMRRWLAHSPPPNLGWFNGLRDPQIASSLKLMHAEPEHDWSVQELASRVAMSRSTFASRFSEVTGEPPLGYLFRWRMTLAAQRLKADQQETVGDVARSVGYDSEAAFSAAFKRHHGMSPGAWRRGALVVANDTAKSA